MRMFSLVRSFILCVVILLSSAVLVWGQGNTNSGDVERRLDQIGQKVDGLVGKLDKAVDGLTNKIDKVSDRVAEQDKELYQYKVLAWAVAGILGAITTLTGLGAALWQVFSGAKETRRERIVTEMLELSHLGEQASQKRADELHNVMLEEGRTTLQLVNDTLTLAKEASTSAINAAKNRVRKQCDELDAKVSDFLIPFANRDNRAIVNSHEKRDELKHLIDTLNGLEYSNSTLDEPIPLKPNCLFLKALEYYLEQQFDTTIKTLQDIVEHSDASNDLKIRSWYWIGYEQNNIGEFDNAENSFTNAIAIAEQSHAPRDRIRELERLRIETMLFNKERYDATDLIDNIDRVIDGSHDEMKDKATITKGNILYAAAMDAYSEGESGRITAIDYMRQAKELWKPLVDEGNLDAEREYALVCLALKENVSEALDLLDRKVRKEVRVQYTTRIEARHKAYFSTIQLMIAKAQNAENRVEPLDTKISQHIGDVHDRERIYSPLRKRNLERHEFQDDIRSLVEHGLPCLIREA